MAKPRRLARAALLVLAVSPSLESSGQAQEKEKVQEKGVLAEPSDAAEVREQIELLEKLKTTALDRGAVLYLLSTAKQHLGETREALSLLKECLALREGFDPSGDAAFFGLKSTKEFEDLVAPVHRDFPAVAQARLDFVTEEKDLIPEGLAYDEKHDLFYLSSLNRKKIVKINAEGRVSDFVPSDRYGLLPVLGIRMDPTDGTVWADTFEDAGRTELVHFDSEGKLLERYAPKDKARHGFNDLVVRKNGEVITTDSLNNQVYRLDRGTRTFAALKVHRSLFYPNGIALADDDHTVYFADAVGVVKVDLASEESRDVDPGPHNTLAGADGLYWHKGFLIAVQNGIGSPRVAAFRLSKDGNRVSQTTVLENRTQFTTLPTTGAIRGNDFYFIANSQIDNLNGEKVMDVTRLAAVRIAVLRLP
ncbi:MAG TPA: SMP-30/gluconolactonase/LRE family protein [Candidatus Angelobacter sp.]|nr:SMP-30/gluconolactonase/LRE family protein [Candidatus Angelobacter sp.]